MKSSILIICGLVAALSSSTALADPSSPPSERRSPAMMYTGISLTALGSATLIGGVSIFAVDATQGSGFAAILLGVPMMIGSTIFAGVGIPLWIVGAQAPDGGSSKIAPAIPAVAIAPGAVTMQWRF